MSGILSKTAKIAKIIQLFLLQYFTIYFGFFLGISLFKNLSSMMLEADHVVILHGFGFRFGAAPPDREIKSRATYFRNEKLCQPILLRANKFRNRGPTTRLQGTTLCVHGILNSIS